MSTWKIYPQTYRQKETERIFKATQAGECVSVVGLSGSGKSNLFGFISHRKDVFPHPTALIDCNRLGKPSIDALFELIRRVSGDTSDQDDEFGSLNYHLEKLIDENEGKYSLLFDRFEVLDHQTEIANNLRALRDIHKYQLTYIIATRHPLDPSSELAELFYNHSFWLGPLSESDTKWNVARYAKRINVDWDDSIGQQIYELSRGYPAFVRAICEAHAGKTKLDLSLLREHPAIKKRLEEFWSDNPSPSDIKETGLMGLPLFERVSPRLHFDPVKLTEKEFVLIQYFQAHPGVVCAKDELVRAVWPEDIIFERGIRDDSLAQLIRRLRVKIEPDPSNPRHILTVPGRGYRFVDQND